MKNIKRGADKQSLKEAIINSLSEFDYTLDQLGRINEVINE